VADTIETGLQSCDILLLLLLRRSINSYVCLCVCVCVCVISKATLRELDKAAELAIIGHSIGAFVSTLDAPHLKHLATNIVRDVTSWLVKLFRY